MKKILLVLVLLCSVLFITGCGKESIVGNYKIVEIVEGDTTLDKNKIKDNNINYTLKVKKDKTAVLNLDERINLKYNDKYFYSTEDSSDKVAYTFIDNKVIMEIDDLKLTFEKK